MRVQWSKGWGSGRLGPHICKTTLLWGSSSIEADVQTGRSSLSTPFFISVPPTLHPSPISPRGICRNTASAQRQCDTSCRAVSMGRGSTLCAVQQYRSCPGKSAAPALAAGSDAEFGLPGPAKSSRGRGERYILVNGLADRLECWE
jgi:hypothetical protein